MEITLYLLCVCVCVGSVVWPLGVHLVVKGDSSGLSSVDQVHLPSLSPGQETQVTVQVRSPSLPGVYQCHWRAALPGGALFGGKYNLL